MARVIDPILADLQCEHDEARRRGQHWRARLNLVRGYVALARAVFWLGLRAASHPNGDTARADAVRTCIVSAVASAFVTVVLVLPPLLSWPRWRSDPGFTALLSVVLVPQALPVSIPAGLCVAVLWAMRGKAVTWRRVGTVLAIALAFTTVVWVVLEWMMPQANQGFRELVAARLSDGRVVTLERGLNELGLSRLGQRTDPAAVHQYRLLLALCFASVPVSLLALGLARHVRRAASAVALAIAVSNAYFAILFVSSARVWTPNLIFLLVGCALLVRAERPKAV